MDKDYINILIAEKVFGWKKNPDGVRCISCWLTDEGKITGEIPNYTGNISDAWKIVEKLQKMVCKFQTADGWIVLKNGEWADHSEDDKCEVEKDDVEKDNGLEDDPCSWSFHIHLGLLAADFEHPKHWRHTDYFCAKAETAEMAICLAALKAFGE